MGWAVSCAVLLAVSQLWSVWGWNSPMMKLELKFEGRIVFPDGPEDRIRYFRNLEIAQGEKVRSATCVWCSIIVRGNVYERVTVLWGDATVEREGGVKAIEVSGGRITLASGAHAGDSPTLLANGGPIAVDPGIPTNPFFVRSLPQDFYPGQRSGTVEGVSRFALLVFLLAVCGEWLAWGSFRERVRKAARQPVGSGLLGIVLFFLTWPLQFLMIVFLFSIPLMAGVLHTVAPVAYLVLIALGFGALSEKVGSMLGVRNRVIALLAGAIFFFVLMLVPVLGYFVMIGTGLVALGAGTGYLLLQPMKDQLAGLLRS